MAWEGKENPKKRDQEESHQVLNYHFHLSGGNAKVGIYKEVGKRKTSQGGFLLWPQLDKEKINRIQQRDAGALVVFQIETKKDATLGTVLIREDHPFNGGVNLGRKGLTRASATSAQQKKCRARAETCILGKRAHNRTWVKKSSRALVTEQRGQEEPGEVGGKDGKKATITQTTEIALQRLPVCGRCVGRGKEEVGLVELLSNAFATYTQSKSDMRRASDAQL